MRCCHELSQGWASKNPIVRQGEVNHIKHNLFSPVVQLSPKRHRQCDLSLRMTPSGINSLKRVGGFQLILCYLKLADDCRGDQIQPGPAVHQHLRDLEVANCWRDQQWQASDHSGTVRMILLVKDDGRA